MNTINIALRLLAIAIALLCYDQQASAADTNSAPQALRKRAEEFVALLSNGKWEAAATNTIIFVGKQDSVTRQRMGISREATRDEMTLKSAAWFKSLYNTVRPGRVEDVRVDPKDPNLMHVTYHHEDLDGFEMRFVDGQWYYTLE